MTSSPEHATPERLKIDASLMIPTIPCIGIGLCLAEAACSHVVRMARHEVEQNPSASVAMRRFSFIREEDAEVGARRELVKEGLTANIHIDKIDLPDTKGFPWVKVSSWAAFLLESGAFPRQLVGVDSFAKMRGVLQEFWNRFRALHGDHPVFGLERDGVVSLDRLVPYYSHSDDGVTFRDGAIMVVSVHGLLGRGTKNYLKANAHHMPLDQNEMGMNYVGNTWGTHCLAATMLKAVQTPENISALFSALAADAKSLLHDGIEAMELGGEKVWMCHLGMQGDMPALVKVGRFQRSFSHVPRASSSRQPCSGVCWLCHAGKEGPGNQPLYPFEDVGMSPSWEPTIGVEVPWCQAPSILEGLGLTEKQSIEFFVPDFFHNAHLGVLKTFTSSALVMIIEAADVIPCFAECGSIESKFEVLTQEYKAFWEERGHKPFVQELSRDTVCWPMASVCPAAKWNKGMATVEVMRFLDGFCQKFAFQQAPEAKLRSIAFRLLWFNLSFVVYCW